MLKTLLITTLLVSQSASSGSLFESDLVAAAYERTKYDVRYDGAYFSISYPNGDVPSNIGVCTDVVVRAYRTLGDDLQRLVHEDISSNFDAYPSNKIWGLTRPDKNIDHRRVPNLQTFFSRHGRTLEITQNPEDYYPADLVTWILPGNLPHIGIVTEKVDTETGRPLIVHNIGNGPQLEDMLLKYKITGHYRYVPEKYRN
ncbi:DUF1287 domain-containing protein [Beggiatoa alba]|nr:DUF1287 domain-containing protein [Beggiatoa alba]